MNKVDLQYMKIAYEILNNGVDFMVKGAKYHDGAQVFARKHRGPVTMEYDLSTGEFPIVSSRQTAFQMLRNELFAFYVYQTNKIEDFERLGLMKIWGDWFGDDGTMGKAYGYQIKSYNLVDRLLHMLMTNPDDRGMIINIWNESDLPYMNIRPCAYLTEWDVTEGYINCMLNQRSGDWMTGVAFNLSQYAILVNMFAQVSGLKAGKLTHRINNAHIYDRHFDNARIQLTREIHPSPKLIINPDIKNFYDFKPEDITLEGYKHSGKLQYDLAVVQNPYKTK